MRTPLLKINYACLAGLFIFAGPLLRADAPAATATHPPDLLAEALPILQAKYADFKTLQFKEGDRLSDLIARSGGKIYLGTPETAPISTALLPGNIVYWRLASFTPKTNWADLAAQFDQWTHQGAEGIVLDLRSSVAPDDYVGAARLAGFFIPNQKTLFSLVPEAASADSVQTFRSAASGPLFHQPVVVVTNRQTTGAAEALAACLKAQGALVVGRATSGKAVDFAEQKLSTGQVLRFAVARVRLADGADLWNHPVVPDISLTVNDQTEKAALNLIGQNGVLDVIREASERRRMSEAALVQGDDPEWDEYLEAHEKKTKPLHPAATPVQDVVLINALDSLKAIEVSQRRAAPSSGGETAPDAPSSVR